MKSTFFNILKIISFSFCFLIMLFFLTWYCKPESYNVDNVRGLKNEEHNSLDMVYLGGSAAFVYWQPLKAYEDIGIKSYSYATDTMQAELYITMIKEVLKTQSPDLFIIDARAFQYRDKDQVPSEVSYRNHLTGMSLNMNKINFINEYIPKINDGKLSYIFDIIKYHSSDLSQKSIKKSINLALGKYDNEYKGFYFVPKIDRIEKYDFDNEEIKKPSEETDEILDELLEYLKQENINCLFVVSPYSETAEHKAIFNYVENKVKKYNFDFVDANEYYDEMNLDFNNDFYNNNHVNIYGSEKYTSFLENYLSNNYYFEVHDDKFNNSWDKYLNNWHKSVSETKKIINGLKGDIKND